MNGHGVTLRILAVLVTMCDMISMRGSGLYRFVLPQFNMFFLFLKACYLCYRVFLKVQRILCHNIPLLRQGFHGYLPSPSQSKQNLYRFILPQFSAVSYVQRLVSYAIKLNIRLQEPFAAMCLC